MSIDVLRRAAAELRAQWSDGDGPRPMGTAWHQERDFHLAVADWLDSTASTMAHVMDDLAAIEGQPTIEQLVGYDFAEALAVARAYLGSAS